MSRSASRPIGWRIAVALAAVLFAPALMGATAGDDPLPALTMTMQPLSSIYSGPVVGTQLTIESGTWSPAPSELSYQWLSDGEPIDGATESYYTPTDDVWGHVLSFTETATLDGYQPYVYTSSGLHVMKQFTATGPSLVGVAQVGVPLVGSVSDIEPTPSSVSYTWVAHGYNVESGPSATTYTPVAADVGQTVTFYVYPRLYGSNYTSLGLQVESAIVLPATFDQETAVKVLGTPIVGNTLSIQQGWYPSPDETDYQWLRDGVPIAGAQSDSYTLASADLRHVVSVSVSVSHSSLATVTVVAAASGPTGIPFTTAPEPTITGTPIVGATLTAHPGEWAPAGATFTYAWSVGGYWSPAYSSNKWVIAGGEVNLPIAVRVTAVAPGYGPTTSQSSGSTAPVAPLPVSLTKVSLGSSAQVDETLEPTFSLKAAYPGVPITYTWYRNGLAIPNSNDETYMALPTDRGSHIYVTLSVTGPGYVGDASATSNTVTVGEGYLTSYGPQIIGTISVGSHLQATTNSWVVTPQHIYYRWMIPGGQSNGQDLLLSTAQDYTPTPSTYGRWLQLWESASAPGFYPPDGWFGTFPVKVAAGALVDDSAPSIAGTAAVGYTLTARSGVWTPAAGLTLRYAWYAAVSADATPVSIPGATAATYVIPLAEKGEVISVRVTVSAHGYVTMSSMSGATNVVVVPPNLRAREPSAVWPHFVLPV